MAVFSPSEPDERPTGLIGTIKKFDSKYGIDTLIEAFSGTPTNGARQARQAPAVSPQMGSGTRPAAAVRTNVGTSSQVPAPTTPTADHRSGGEDVRKPKHMATRVAA